MDRQVLTSSRAVRDTSRYAVGILDQNELHITPIEGILSLRPSMEYLDQSDKTAKGMLSQSVSYWIILYLGYKTTLFVAWFVIHYYFSLTLKAEGRGLLTDNDLEDVKDSSAMFSDEEGESDMKAVTVRFARGGQNEKEKYAKIKEKSYEYQQKKLREEPWVKTNFHNLKSQKWEEQSQKLFCRKMDEEIVNLNSTPSAYLNHLK